MSKTLSAKHYQENKERLQKKSLLKTKKSDNMVANVTKIFQKMKNKSLLSIEKIIIEREKTLCYNYKEVF